MKQLIILLNLFILFACTQRQPVKQDESVSNDLIKYAQNFKIIQQEGFIELQIVNPENGTIERDFALVKRNSNSKISSKLEQIEVPLKSIITLSGTNIGMIEKINESAKIVGVSNSKYIYNQTVQQGLKNKKVLEFDDFSILNPERVLLTKSKILFHTGFEGNTTANEDKLLKLGVLCIPNYDWKENHPLGKAEWIKVFGYLFGKEKVAEAYFEKVEKNYLQLSKTAKSFTKKPTVFSGMVYGDTWYMPAGESFGAKLLADAGADYVSKNEKGTGSMYYSFEQVFKKNQSTDFWVNVEVPTKKEMLKSNGKYQYFKAFQSNNLYSYAHRMNYFWENSAVEPDRVLSDLIQIFHQGEVKAESLHFYRKLTE